MKLSELDIGGSAVITAVGGGGSLRQHFLDMGVIPGATVTLTKYAPMGDPMELRIYGCELTMRVSDADKIEIRLAGTSELSQPARGRHRELGERRRVERQSIDGERSRRECGSERCGGVGNGFYGARRRVTYRGLGESNGYMPHAVSLRDGALTSDGASQSGGALPSDGVLMSNAASQSNRASRSDRASPSNRMSRSVGAPLTFALAGNQNCGKTTLFNQLTGSNQHVGNFPGVTVDRKSGSIKGHPDTSVIDLPGIYSLSPYTSEEIVSRRFILDERPSGIINIVDATNIERNLYLTLQLMELDVPMVLALNMMDEMRGSGGAVRINEMEERLGIPVVPISASKNEGVDEVVRHALHVAQNRECPGRTDFCSKDENGGAVHRCLHGIMHLIEDHAAAAGIPVRFAASKLIEGDARIEAALKLSENEREMIEHIIVQMESERGLDRAAAIADMRFSFITALCRDTVVRPHESREHIRSRRIDRVLTGRFTAIPMFILIMAAIFYLTFGLIGAYLQELLDGGITALTSAVDAALTRIGVSEVIHSLVVDGIFAGVGSVLSFVPIIVILFFFLSMLEDSGYMARVAFVTDKLLRKIGLSGRSIVPMLIGFGCTVPGVMASRTLPSDRDRKLTVLLTPMMSCTAKLPIYGFFAAVFFPGHSWLVVSGLYLLGILVGILTALITKKTMFRGEAVPFVMELPNYRMPGAKNVGRLLLDKTKDFVRRAFTVIFIASVIIWALRTFDFRFVPVSDAGDSMLARIAGFISPIFRPLGFGTWQIVTALFAGFMAKESVVSTLSVLLSGAAVTSIISPSAALALLVFCLLYTPCVAAVAAIRRELGRGWAAGIVVWQCTIAWIFAALTKLLFTYVFPH